MARKGAPCCGADGAMTPLAVPVLQLVLGLVLLVAGADLLVRGASRLALALGMTPLLVGLTVVAIGTSTPELSVSLGAAAAGSPGIALGNVIGSNIANILLILGLVAVLVPLTVDRQLVRLDVPVMIGATLAVVVMARDGAINRAEGVLLLLGIVSYITYLFRLARRHPAPDPPADGTAAANAGASRLPACLALVVVGLALLAFGAKQLVSGATALAAAAGLSELVIGLTVVAVGTSLPEITTALLAALRGQRELAVGNVVGSNILNLLLVLGGAAVLAPEGVAVSPGTRAFDLPIMLAVTLASLPVFMSGYRIARWEGALFLAYYLAYVLYLLLEASSHEALGTMAAVMRQVVIPLTVATLAITLVRALKMRTATHRQPESNPP